MKIFYRLFKQKALEIDFDHFVRNIIDRFDDSSSRLTFDGGTMYYNKSENTFHYGSMEINIKPEYDYNFSGDITEVPREISIIFNERFRRSEKYGFLSFSLKSNELLLPSKDGSLITAPFDVLNEIDFFQFEVLNPLLPISTKTLIRLFEKIKGVYL